ncbi:hypothetical protein Ga0466249_002265 [Sporomusaceae bacterium BoRhaA]|uniref:YjcQ family protein n=1 Tax=Pelorhabdus rhamnosifermentans TaxID=2772457 RepID=UPI001C060E48|nr:YjcQ family protein [Pelorhabdus rhamnosifermentans]MBU2701151.1 hypothetical protein [Pelorhabdus rhamnosifermentans]
MEFDTKQKVLIAMYVEYQKDLPNMDENITPENLGLQEEIFAVAIEKLLNEELINGADVTRCIGTYDQPEATLFGAMLTSKGISYVEEKLGINSNLSGKEKIEVVRKSFLEQGLDVLTDFAAKVTAELIKAQT